MIDKKNIDITAPISKKNQPFERKKVVCFSKKPKPLTFNFGNNIPFS